MMIQAITTSFRDKRKKACIFTDASTQGWSYIITQCEPDKLDKPGQEQRHQLLVVNSNLASFVTIRLAGTCNASKEAYPIRHAVERHRHLLLGDLPFASVSDHKTLTYVLDEPTRVSAICGGFYRCRSVSLDISCCMGPLSHKHCSFFLRAGPEFLVTLFVWLARWLFPASPSLCDFPLHQFVLLFSPKSRGLFQDLIQPARLVVACFVSLLVCWLVIWLACPLGSCTPRAFRPQAHPPLFPKTCPFLDPLEVSASVYKVFASLRAPPTDLLICLFQCCLLCFCIQCYAPVLRRFPPPPRCKVGLFPRSYLRWPLTLYCARWLHDFRMRMRFVIEVWIFVIAVATSPAHRRVLASLQRFLTTA